MIESKMGILTLSALLNTLKIPVNGYDILLEKRLSGVAELKYISLYGKSQLNDIAEMATLAE